MNEQFFIQKMENDPQISSSKGIATRLSKARKAEKILEMDYDTIVANDDLMYNSLMKLKPLENPRNNPMQNTLRKYYFYKNGKDFPRLTNYNLSR